MYFGNGSVGIEKNMGNSNISKIYDTIEKVYREKERLIVFIVSAAVLGGILFGTGSIFSGWHRIDDHETYRIIKLYADRNVPMHQTIFYWLKNDLRIRWRPLYWIIRSAMPYFLGDHPAIYKFILYLIGVGTYIALYWSAGNLKCSKLFSHFFALLILTGRQFEVWCRIANQENLGIFFFAVCLYLITWQYKKDVFERRTDIFIVILAVCSGLMKESFLLLLPGIVWLRLGLEAAHHLQCPKDIIRIFIRNIVFITVSAIIFLANIYIIVVHVGVNRIGYAGLDTNYGIKEYIYAMKQLCKESLYIYVLLAGVILFICLISLFTAGKKKFDSDIKLLSVLLIFSGYVLFTQMILHAKSGMWNRYLLPWIAAYAIILVVCTDLLTKNVWCKVMLGFIIGGFLIGRLKFSIFDISYDYAREAKAINKVYDLVFDITEPDSKVINAFSNVESDMSFGLFMELQGRSYVYCYDFEEEQAEDVFGEHSGESIRIEEADVFVSWKEDEEVVDNLLESYGEWDKSDIMGLYNVYVKQ